MRRTAAALAVLGTAICMTPVHAMSLKDAVARAVASNPQIDEARASREATEFELDQAKGLYLPRLDVEGYVGWERRYGGPATSSRSGDTREANLVLNQLIFDGFSVWAEKHYQASRVDAASFRVFERSEFIGLAVVRDFVEVKLYNRVIRLERANLGKLRGFYSRVSRGISGGTTSVADREQAEERIKAAQARIEESIERRNAAAIRLRRLVGEPIGSFGPVRSLSGKLPNSLTSALAMGRGSSPIVQIARADLDAAYGLYKKAESEFYPKLNFEGRARAGDDLDDIRGRDGELRGQFVLRWNLYKGGIDSANKQEQIRRMDEARARLRNAIREVEEAVRLSWDRRTQQAKRLGHLRRQLEVIDRLIRSYAEQFQIGQRSLLDLLDTQNAKLNAQVLVANAEAAALFAEYRILAATGRLLETLHVPIPEEAVPYAQAKFVHKETPEYGTLKRTDPKSRKYGGWGALIFDHKGRSIKD
jgi:adhesin transport system outer membrane protein